VSRGARLARLGIVVGCAAGVACSSRDRPGGAGDSVAVAVMDSVRPAAFLRVMLTPDSAAAVITADSLAREGWEAEASKRSANDSTWPVSVTIPGDADLAKLVAYVLRQSGFEPLFIGMRTRPQGLAVTVTPVNHGTHGMSARVRWSLSDDRRAVLVVEDPRGVENDPVPNGFVFAREGAPPVQRDSVWDVAASPDWHRVAYARAYTTRAGETDSVPPSEWHRLAGSVGLLESIVRKGAFRTSGMVTAYGSARPFVVEPGAPVDTTGKSNEGLPIAEGWRVAWNSDGSRLAIGSPPDVIADDGPPSRWRFVDPTTGAARGVADGGTLLQPTWSQGPNLDVATTVDMKQRRAFRSGDVDIESEDGWIRVYTRDGPRLRAPRIIGPGIALTATANGQFIVAIAPDPSAKSYDPPNSLIVYHLLRR
jgi:hypothetical protein